MDFKEIRERGLLLFEYVRGSKLYGLSTENSDEDHGGVFIEPIESVLGYIKCPETVMDEKQDECWYSLGKYLGLLSMSNPNILESLFVPEDKILYKHPLFDVILNHREEFLSKKCFGSFMGYAKTQLQKARNLKKKIVCPPGDKKKSVVEFYFYGTDDGKTKKVQDFLKENEMDQKFIGLSKMDNMRCSYSAFYDWGGHLKEMGIDTFDKFSNAADDACFKEGGFIYRFLSHICTAFPGLLYYVEDILEVNETELKKVWEVYKTPFFYRGLTNSEDTTGQLRFSSIPKGERRILEVSYDKDGYQKYCKVYKEWNDFKKHHNPERFNLAKEKTYDYKNACHCARLLEMGIEIAQGKGVLIDRTNIDREFLMNIRQGKMEYEDLMTYLEGKDEIMKSAMEESNLPEEIDINLLNEVSLSMRSQFYGINLNM